MSLSPLAHGISNFARAVPRQSLRTDGYGGEGSLIPALATENKPATVIVLHGLGGNGNEWAYLFLPVSLLSLTYVNFILPTAASRPVTYMKASMPSWFDITKLDTNVQLNRTDLKRSVQRVNRIVEGEIRKGISSERIFLMGFSQGGAVALTAFLQSRRILGGCMGVATWLPLRHRYMDRKSDKVKKKKILLLHVSFLKNWALLDLHILSKSICQVYAAVRGNFFHTDAFLIYFYFLFFSIGIFFLLL